MFGSFLPLGIVFMSDVSFKALRVESTEDGKFTQKIVDRQISELPENDLLVAVQYSSLNFKDALSAAGKPGVTRNYPHTPGIDAAGVVIEDKSGTFKAGDEVIVSGYDLGMNTSGGFAQRIRVPAEWAIALPAGLSLKETMCIGTAGFTAALCVGKLLRMGAKPEDGTVIVTGATGGVGSFSVSILSKLGFEVAALTGKPESSDLLKALGAKQIVARAELEEASKKPMLAPQWAHAVDCVGGEILSNILKTLQYGGSAAICGLTASVNFSATVLPFILRNINLLGVDCVELPLAKKRDNWQALATDFKLADIEGMAEEITLEQAPDYLARVLNGQAVGRYVVKLPE
ncbi:YhdH/YhfP family quinone oxidoreductase [Aurantivibrio infirmus]